MNLSNTAETNLLKLLFTNIAWANIGDAGGLLPSAGAGSLYISLHTADPGEAGDQTTNEATYTGYVRIAVARSVGGWTVTNNQAVNAALIQFAACTGGANTITHFGIGRASAGAGELLLKAPLTTSGAGPLIYTATAADVLTIPGHAFSVNDTLQSFAVLGIPAPAGITDGVNYFVKTVSGNDITISATLGGATLDITAAGAAMLIKTTTLAVSVNIQPQFAAGVLKIFDE